MAEPTYTMALAEGNIRRGTVRVVGMDKDTAYAWLDRAGRHGHAVTASLFDTLPIAECQLDALWSFVWKTAAHLTVVEKVLDGMAMPDMDRLRAGMAIDSRPCRWVIETKRL